ncbi:MAG TPA: hypothetical protein VIR15_04855, partial [Intrasporangium sp.]
AGETLGGATVVAEQVGGPVGAAILDAARSAFASGMHAAVSVAAGVAVFGTLIALAALPRTPIGHAEEVAAPAASQLAR